MRREGGRRKELQRAEYEEPGKKARETRPERTGKAREAKAEGAAPGEAAVRQRREERGKEETEAE